MIFIIGVVSQGLSDSSKRAYELAHELASEGEMATEFLQAFFNQIETASAQGEFQDDMSPLLVPHNSREQVTRMRQPVLHLENDAVCSDQIPLRQPTAVLPQPRFGLQASRRRCYSNQTVTSVSGNSLLAS